MNKNTGKRTRSQKTYLDYFTKMSYFPEFRVKNALTELVIKQFLPEAAEKCLEIKRRYENLNKPISKDKLIEIIFAEGFFINTDSDNGLSGNSATRIDRYTKDGESFYVINANPQLSLDKGIPELFRAFAACSLKNYIHLYFDEKPKVFEVSDADKNPEHFRLLVLVDVLASMLQSGETEAELTNIANGRGENE